MKIIKENSPHIHKASSVKRMMIDVLIALIPVTIMAIVQYQFKAVKVLGISIVTMLLAEFVFCLLTMQEPYNGERRTLKTIFKNTFSKMTINNITAPLISAIIFALIMPAEVSWYIVLVGALFGIVVGKLVFGGLGGNIFNPAAVGRVFAMICFGVGFKYLSINSLGSSVDIFAGGTPLVQNIFTWEAIKNLFIGTIPGSMGEVNKIAIIIGGGYLLIRKSADFRPMLAMILSFMVIMLFVGLKIEGVNPFMYMLYQTLAGGLLFGAVFMVTDPITSPTTKPGRVTFGILIGLISAFIRLYGAYPEGVAFAIIIANMFVPVIDYPRFSNSKYTWKHFLFWGIIMALAIVVVLVTH